MRDVFIQTRNAMIRALLGAGVDPLVTGSVMVHMEQMSAYVMLNDRRITRLEKRETRQVTRQKGRKQQKPTASNVVQFPGVTA